MARPPGATLASDICTEEEERTLLEAVDREAWSNSHPTRRTQHYGRLYDYGTMQATQAAPPLPSWTQTITARLCGGGSPPEQMIVNEYVPGVGIGKHIDSPAFGEPIISVSLGSAVVMRFESADGRASMDAPLPRRSALILTGESRWQWTHEIARSKQDTIDGKLVDRSRRVSLTFRWLKK